MVMSSTVFNLRLYDDHGRWKEEGKVWMRWQVSAFSLVTKPLRKVV